MNESLVSLLAQVVNDQTSTLLLPHSGLYTDHNRLNLLVAQFFPPVMENYRIGILAQIQRLRHEGGVASSQVMQDLKRQYNSTVEEIYKNTTGGFRDIIDVFPSEIWISVIQDSLPVQDYPSALLLLTMVSVRWQKAIIAIPILWSRIQISGLDEDALATIHTFLHLSRNTALVLTINVPLYHEPGIFHSILADVSARLHRVVIRADERYLEIGYSTGFCGDHIASVIRILLGSLQYYSGVVEIDIQPQYEVIHGDTPLGTAVNIVPPGLQRMPGWCFCSLDSWILSGAFQHLEEVQTCMAFEDSIHHLGLMPKVKTLLMTGPEDPSISRRRKQVKDLKLPNLTRVSLMHTDRPTLVKLVELTGSTLFDLELTMTHEECIDLLEVLRIATRLARLSLRLIQSDVQGSERRDLSQPSIHPGETITSLRSLELPTGDDVDFTYDTALERAIRHHLLLTFEGLYKCVEDAVVSFDFVEGHLPTFWNYISRLPHLKRLQLKGSRCDLASEHQVLVLPALEELDTITAEPLRFLRAPRLLSLKLPWDEFCNEIGAFTYKNVRTLHIEPSHLEMPRIRFPSGNLPAVTTLEINAMGRHVVVQPGALQFLRTVSITAREDSPIASSLCMTLLCMPEDCPALCDIKLLGFGPEWDILFMMLEKRNFLGNTGVSRIRRITLPYVPNELRDPLAGLLRGLYTPRPSNEDLSFVVLMKIFFNNQIAGCRTCMRNRMYPCNVPVTFGLGVEFKRVHNSIYSTVKDPPAPAPADMAPETLEWIRWREVHIPEWKAAVRAFGWWRTSTCEKQWYNVPMEMTEHDA